MPRASAPSAPPSDERRAKKSQAIVDAAARLFARHGYADCEMEQVAGDLKIAKGTLYLYFPGKAELFCACVDQGMREMQGAIRQAAEETCEPFEKISRAIRGYLEFFDAHPHYVELLIQERANFKSRKRPSYFEHRDANRGPWRTMYEQLIAEGRMRGDLPVERILDTIGNLLYGTMFTNFFAGRSVSIAEQHQALLAIVFRGILSDAERESLEMPCSNGKHTPAKPRAKRPGRPRV